MHVALQIEAASFPGGIADGFARRVTSAPSRLSKELWRAIEYALSSEARKMAGRGEVPRSHFLLPFSKAAAASVTVSAIHIEILSSGRCSVALSPLLTYEVQTTGRPNAHEPDSVAVVECPPMPGRPARCRPDMIPGERIDRCAAVCHRRVVLACTSEGFAGWPLVP
eukprot:103365-Prymnesium_polylepis.1